MDRQKAEQHARRRRNSSRLSDGTASQHTDTKILCKDLSESVVPSADSLRVCFDKPRALCCSKSRMMSALRNSPCVMTATDWQMPLVTAASSSLLCAYTAGRLQCLACRW